MKKTDIVRIATEAFEWFMENEGFPVSDFRLKAFSEAVEWEFNKRERERIEFEEWESSRVMECSVCGKRLNDSMASCLQGDVLCDGCFGWGVGVLEGANARPRSSQAPI